MNKEDLKELLKRNLPDVDQRSESIEEIGKNHIILKLPVKEEYVSKDFPGLKGKSLLSGPIILGFGETAMYACIHAFYGSKVSALVVKYQIEFKRPVGLEDLLAKVTIIEKEESRALLTAEIMSTNSSELIASVSAQYSVKPISDDYL